jgi:hypothetical protein
VNVLGGNSVALVSQRTIPTELPPLVGEVSPGFLCPNNPLNVYVFMQEELPKYANKKIIPNIKINFTLF